MEKPRLAIVGPLKPYRGGIAEHTTRFYQSLKEDAFVHVEAYSEPFPRLLYPGQHTPKIGSNPNCISEINYDLTYNPFKSWSLALDRIVKFQPNAIIVPWWTFFFAPHYFWMCSRLNRLGIPAIFLCHNLIDHEASVWKKWGCVKTLALAKGFIFHSACEERKANEYFPNTPTLLFPHPIYDHINFDLKTKQTIEPLRLLFFGIVRKYKGLEDLISAIERIKSSRVHLTVAGEWWKGNDKLHKRCEDLSKAGMLTLIDRFVTDHETKTLFENTHALILPYRKATNSGVLALAIRARKPAIVTRTGALPVSVIDGKTGYIVPPGDQLALIEAIRKLSNKIKIGYDFGSNIENLGKGMSWNRFAEKSLNFIESVQPSKRTSD